MEATVELVLCSGGSSNCVLDNEQDVGGIRAIVVRPVVFERWLGKTSLDWTFWAVGAFAVVHVRSGFSVGISHFDRSRHIASLRLGRENAIRACRFPRVDIDTRFRISSRGNRADALVCN
jgi:hypothetical protein